MCEDIDEWCPTSALSLDKCWISGLSSMESTRPALSDSDLCVLTAPLSSGSVSRPGLLCGGAFPEVDELLELELELESESFVSALAPRPSLPATGAVGAGATFVALRPRPPCSTGPCSSKASSSGCILRRASSLAAARGLSSLVRRLSPVPARRAPGFATGRGGLADGTDRTARSFFRFGGLLDVAQVAREPTLGFLRIQAPSLAGLPSPREFCFFDLDRGDGGSASPSVVARLRSRVRRGFMSCSALIVRKIGAPPFARLRTLTLPAMPSLPITRIGCAPASGSSVSVMAFLSCCDATLAAGPLRDGTLGGLAGAKPFGLAARRDLVPSFEDSREIVLVMSAILGLVPRWDFSGALGGGSPSTVADEPASVDFMLSTSARDRLVSTGLSTDSGPSLATSLSCSAVASPAGDDATVCEESVDCRGFPPD
mmetsp:Transcript_11094/g.31630  ORF Transcript_11094/g.31630 Transcript_11094/m.31630 type:complete len:429 (+) Transcript_11094:1458-2744(+)